MPPDNSHVGAEAEPMETHSVDDSPELTPGASDSVTHPYRTLLEDTSFARCHLVSTPSGRAESFTRSLYMLGNGTPLWEPVGDILLEDRPSKPSLSIGDVGFLDEEGRFEYYFNVFKHPLDPMQKICPPDMEPLLSPPEVSDIQTNPLHFAPGTTLVTKGVQMVQNTSSPLDINFTVKAREGAIVIFPDGASRQDLVSTARIRDYVQKNALKWYMFINEMGHGRTVCPNGYLYLVTGCDKSSTWAIACSPQDYQGAGDVASVRYRGDKSEVWQQKRGVRCESREASGTAETSTMFIRGMRIAVNVSDWTKYVLGNEPPEEVTFYNVMTVPVLGLRAKVQTFVEKRRNYPLQYTSEPTDFLLHPLTIILRYLIEEFPTSDVAIVEDSMWSAVTNSESDSDLSSITRLLVKVLEIHGTVKQDGWVTLERTPEKLQDKGHETLLGVLKGRYQEQLHRRRISRKISKIFPGSPVPFEQLRNISQP